MNRPTLERERLASRGRWRKGRRGWAWLIDRWLVDRSGATAVAFALILPALLTLTFGSVEVARVMLDYHRATEATRHATRLAIINEPIISLQSLQPGGSIVCTGTSSGVSCPGTSVVNAAAFETIVNGAISRLPIIERESVRVRYTHTGIGQAGSPGGLLPQITVSLVNVPYETLAMHMIPGVPRRFTFPEFSTSQIAGGAG